MFRLIHIFVLLPLVGLLCFSLNYILLPNLSPYDDKRVLELIIVTTALLWGVLGGGNVMQPQSWVLRLGIVLMLVLGGVSCTAAESPRYALLEVSLFAGLAYLAFWVAAIWKEYRQIGLVILLGAIGVGAVLYMIGFYTGYLASFLEGIPLRWPEPFFMLSNVRSFNQYQLWTLGLFCLPLLDFSIERVGYRRALFGIFSAWWILLFASASRGVLLAWLLAMLVTAACYRQVTWPLLRLQLSGFSVGLACFGLLFHWLPAWLVGGVVGSEASGTLLRETTSDRFYLWKHAWAMVKNHPWLGVGPMHYAWYPNAIAAHPHNSVVQLAAEWGLPATLLILGIVGYGIACYLKRFNPVTMQANANMDQHLPVVLFFTLIANMAYSLVDGVLVMPLSQVMMVVVVGLMVGLYATDKPLPDALMSQQLVSRFFAGIVLVALVWSVLPELLPRLAGNAEIIPMNYQTMGPRFWQEGGIAH